MGILHTALVSLSDITLTVIISLNKRNRVFDAHGETLFARLEISIYESIVVTQCKFDGSLFYLYTVYQPLFIMFRFLYYYYFAVKLNSTFQGRCCIALEVLYIGPT